MPVRIRKPYDGAAQQIQQHGPHNPAQNPSATLSAAYRSGRWCLRAGGGYELRRSIEMIADRTGHSVIVDEQAMYKNRIWHADAKRPSNGGAAR